MGLNLTQARHACSDRPLIAGRLSGGVLSCVDTGCTVYKGSVLSGMSPVRMHACRSQSFVVRVHTAMVAGARSAVRRSASSEGPLLVAPEWSAAHNMVASRGGMPVGVSTSLSHAAAQSATAPSVNIVNRQSQVETLSASMAQLLLEALNDFDEPLSRDHQGRSVPHSTHPLSHQLQSPIVSLASVLLCFTYVF